MSPSIPSKPFRETHGEQISLVRSFDWLDLSALDGIDDEYRELLADAEYIDDIRREVLVSALSSRIQVLKEIVQ